MDIMPKLKSKYNFDGHWFFPIKKDGTPQTDELNGTEHLLLRGPLYLKRHRIDDLLNVVFTSTMLGAQHRLEMFNSFWDTLKKNGYETDQNNAGIYGSLVSASCWSDLYHIYLRDDIEIKGNIARDHFNCDPIACDTSCFCLKQKFKKMFKKNKK